jgi:hypothetical protein
MVSVGCIGRPRRRSAEMLAVRRRDRGELLRRTCAATGVRWAVFRYSAEVLPEEGELVLASPEADRHGLPFSWAAPHRDLLAMATDQLRDPEYPGERIAGRDDVAELLTVFRMRREDLGG